MDNKIKIAGKGMMFRHWDKEVYEFGDIEFNIHWIDRYI